MSLKIVFILALIAADSGKGEPLVSADYPDRCRRPDRESSAVLAERLTQNDWRHVAAPRSSFAREIRTWEFYPGQSFRWRFVSDYTEQQIGAWAISATCVDRGVMFLAHAAQAGAPTSRFDVLSIEFRNGTLRLGERRFQGIAVGERLPPPHIDKASREALDGHQRHRFFPLWAAMTSVRWRSVSTPRPGDPDSYSFREDGTYSARFSSTSCQYTGSWSLNSLGGMAGDLRLSVPANRCDPRGPRDAFVRGMPVKIRNSLLHAYKALYSPEDRN
jgi:hypothetical protein